MTDMPGSQFAEMLAALSQPARLKIVTVAKEGGPDGTAAGDIARAVRCPPSTLSFHLKELTRCGLLRASQQGRFIRYTVRPAAFVALAEFIRALPRGAGQKAGARAVKARPAGRRKGGATPAAGTDEQLSIFGD